LSDYENTQIRPDARLIMLKALQAQIDNRLHSGFLIEELRAFGIDRSREWVHGEVRWLAEMGAVTITEAGTVLVATLTEQGARHLRRSVAIEGVKRPSLPGG